MRDHAGLPAPVGLYSPEFEHDACGAGFICSLKGEQSHDIVKKGLQILVNLAHRGACGCDPKTGDGAGILLQMPHEFLQHAAADHGIRLGHPREYAAGLVFLPRDQRERGTCMEMFEQTVGLEGQDFLGWRPVPVDNSSIGETAKVVEPVIMQIFIGRGAGIVDDAHFERKLYVIRKVMERAVRESNLRQRSYFYVPSLSSLTIVYKGLLLADQVEPFFKDLAHPEMKSALAMVHQRYSTNTFPTWDLAHPFRFLCHNGEINTLRGNYNWMTARQGLFQSELFGDDMAKLFPVLTPGASDSATLDNALELLYHTGRSLPHAMMMLIPEAWQNHETMSDAKKAFYEYHSCLMEPWDGPASIPFADGKFIGAVLDRNGLRPSRYTETHDGFVIMGSETGVVDIDPANVKHKGRLQPGRMFLIDMDRGKIVDDNEIKEEMASRKPYRAWLGANLVKMDDLPKSAPAQTTDHETLVERQKVFGYSLEDLRILMAPMAMSGLEPIGSMGDDTPLSVLSERPQLLYTYFKQLFAQVTNPPLDGIREELVTSPITTIGREGDLFAETEEHCRQLRLDRPVLTNAELEAIRALDRPALKSVTLPILFPVAGGPKGMAKAITALCAAASRAVDDGATILILSDRGVDKDHAPIPALLACAGVHHHLIREQKRTRCGLVIESGEPREVHHFSLLFGYGAGAVNPYLAFETIEDMIRQDMISGVEFEKACYHFIKAVDKGVLKVASKMGISTLHSYRGAQIFEAVGLNKEVIDKYFSWTASRIAGVGVDTIGEETLKRHAEAFPTVAVSEKLDLDVGGRYQWRRGGEHHLFNPLSIAKLQQAVRIPNSNGAASHEGKSNGAKAPTLAEAAALVEQHPDAQAAYNEYAQLINDQSRTLGTLRGLLDFRFEKCKPVPLEEVEDWTKIALRFKTGAMSYGSISKEAHENLAIAMNRIGGKSNTGEGGEDSDRYARDENGDLRRSAIKQVASGRFGVTINYLVNADELQIKMAQGAKPGEGGQLPGEKVYPWIAKTRHSTPWVGLISPPPHHDIYSIEDLAQLIHDLKNANSKARINVKLVAEVGVGTVAAGVSKGKADVVLISGYDGGTGASPQTSIKHAGLPWELGIAETHQTLVMNDLRSRIVVECDGQLKTGRDVAIACLLGAEEFGFATAPLVATGCIMMRKCHLNTCPVGIATQNPELRKKFTGTPDQVVNFFYFVAQELRQIMAKLGFRTIVEMVGHVEKLNARKALDHWKAKGLDFSKILHKAEAAPGVGVYCSQPQDHGLEGALDHELIKFAKPALERGESVERDIEIKNINRTVGAMLSGEIARRYGDDGLPDDTIVIRARGSAGQSFGAFAARGLTFRVEGDANDYFGKGLSGGKLVVVPPKESTFVPEENILIGNVALYGATSGELYARGRAGERFCVRNSGARAVVEGVGDHGCEYMTGGRAVILGSTGRNFAAGMSGGVAYVLDQIGDFGKFRCNAEMVDLESVTTDEDASELREMIQSHRDETGSELAGRVLANWDALLPKFVKVIPRDYKKALQRIAEEQAAMAKEEAEKELAAAR